MQSDANFVKLTQSVAQSYDGGSTHKDTATQYEYDGTHGGLTKKTMFGEVTVSDDAGSYSDTGTDKLIASTTYAVSTTTNTRGLPSIDQLYDQSLNKVSETKYYYDNLAHGGMSKGLETKKEFWKSGSSYISNQKAYDQWGLITQFTDGRNKVTTFTIDDFKLHPATTTNALGQVTAYTYNYHLGKVKRTKDSNGYMTEVLYDGFGRPQTEKQSDLTATSTLLTRATYTYQDSTLPRSVQKTENLNSTQSITSYTYLDGLSRPLQTRITAEDSNNYSVRDFMYDARGKLYRESLPYFSTGSSKTATTTTASLYSTFIYDALGRASSTANAVGTTSYAYTPWKTTITDPAGKVKSLYTDAYGNLSQVDEVNNGSTYSTQYQYNGLGKLTKITDALANIRNFTYDGLGRRTNMQDLHAVADTSFGSTTYAYDDANNLIQKIDPKNQTTDYTYDDINRVLTENYTGLAGTEVAYSYDSCLNGIGRLCVATSTGAVATYTYHPDGQIKAEAKAIGGTTYTSQFAYDRLGNPTSIIYPDNSEVQYQYNNAGLVEKVIQKESGGTFSDVISDFDYGPTGSVTYKLFGNGVETFYTYDAAHLYRLTNILTTAPVHQEEGGGNLGFSFVSQPLAYAGESQTVQKNYRVAGYTANSTRPLALLDTENLELAQTISTSTESSATTSAKKLPLSVDAEALKLKAPQDKILGSKVYPDRVVKYAYKSETKVNDVPVSEKIANEAQKAGLKLGSELIDKRTSKARVFATNELNMFVTEVISGDGQYYKDEQGEWWVVEYATTTKDSYDHQIKAPKKNIVSRIFDFFVNTAHAVTATFYPDSNTETATVDGYIGYYSNANPSWSTIHNAQTGTESYDANTTSYVQAFYRGHTGGINRSVFLFDTSSIPDAASVSSATLSLYVYDTRNDEADGYDYINVVQSSPASNTALSNADYDQVGAVSNPTKGSTDKDVDTITEGAYADFVLNTTGKSWVNLTGITKLGVREGHDIENVSPDAGGDGTYMNVYTADYTGTSNDPKLVVVYQYAPDAPTSLLAEGQTNPTNITDPTPEFSAIYNDTDNPDLATSYEIQVSTSNTFPSTHWDSGKTTLSSSTPRSTRSPDISYAGPTLATETTYYWRIKFWDQGDADSPWSAAASFSLASTTYSGQGYETIQDITISYDAAGNITQILDASDTLAAKTVMYTYDDLHRLTLASTTSATSTAFIQRYAYDALGNITGLKANSVATSTYTYAGTSYANPHAATNIGGTSLTYDNNGNVIAHGANAFAWDYRNRLASSTASGLGTTYSYDDSNQRVAKVFNGVTTKFPNKYYNIASATSTKHIFSPNGTMLATVIGNGSATTTNYIHPDHLGGTNAITNIGQNVVEVADYYPYGEQRIAQTYGGSAEQRKFTGYEFDSNSGLNYAGSRYQDSRIGKFMSQDPAFLDIGSKEFDQNYQRTLQQHLSNPQALNSYSYALNNPVKYTDPQGEIVPLIIGWAAIEIGLSAYDVYSTANTIADPNTSWGEKFISGGLTIAGFTLPGGGYGKIGKEALQIYKQTNTAGRILMEGVENIDVLKVIKDNYRVGSKVGKDGSTADAVIHEILTGEKVGGKLHSIKAQNEINRINNIINKYGSELKPQEQKVLNQISNDLKNALKTKK